MKKIFRFIPALCLILAFISSCKKTYIEGPEISLRSKINRITGKWKLVRMEGVTRLNANVEQYMELKEDEISDGIYQANLTNFQEEFCAINPDTVGEALFTCDGRWSFFGGTKGCADEYELDEKEGLSLSLSPNKSYLVNSEWHMVASQWQILRLTNRHLKIKQFSRCEYNPCFFRYETRTLTFEKL